MDIEYLLWLQGLRETASPVVQAFFTFLGSDSATIVLMIVPCLVYWCLDKRTGQLAMFAFGLSGMCNQLIKDTVCRYRPWILDSRVVPDPVAQKGATGYSFPSTHTQSASSVLGSIGWSNRVRRGAFVGSLLVAALIGFSRNFLGVHTPQDVLVGFAVGLVFVYVAGRVLAWVDEDPGRDMTVLVAAVVGTVAALVYVTVKPYPVEYVDGQLLVDPADMIIDCYKTAGLFVGLVSGWVVERHFVDFEASALSLREIIARLVVGVAILLAVYIPLGHAIVAVLGSYAGQLVRHAIVFLLAAGVVPLLFAPLSRVLGNRS